MRRIIVTGGAGFVGAYAVRQLAAAGWEVHTVSRRLHEFPSGIIEHVGDLLDAEVASRIMSQVKPTHWLHLAWCTEPGQYWRSLDNFRWLASSLTLLRSFAESGGQHVVMAGTCAEYDWNYGFCSESVTPLQPATPYGVAKNALRGLLESFCREAEVRWGWGRIFFLYGPSEHPARLVPSVIRSLLRGEPALCTSGEQIRDFLHVSDVASAFVSLLNSDASEVVNIGSGQPIAIRTIIESIGSRIGKPELVKLGARPLSADEPPLLVADSRRLRALGWRPQYSLDAGLDEAVAWWKAHDNR